MQVPMRHFLFQMKILSAYATAKIFQQQKFPELWYFMLGETCYLAFRMCTTVYRFPFIADNSSFMAAHFLHCVNGYVKAVQVWPFPSTLRVKSEVW